MSTQSSWFFASFIVHNNEVQYRPLQHNTDFAKTNQNEVMQIRTNFFEDFGIRKLFCENEFMILNL